MIGKNVTDALRKLAWIAVAGLILLAIAWFLGGCKGIDLAKRETTTAGRDAQATGDSGQQTTITASGDVSVRQVIGYSGWCMVIPAGGLGCLVLIYRQAVRRLVCGIEKHDTCKQAKRWIHEEGWYVDLSKRTRKDWPQKLIHKHAKRAEDRCKDEG